MKIRTGSATWSAISASGAEKPCCGLAHCSATRDRRQITVDRPAVGKRRRWSRSCSQPDWIVHRQLAASAMGRIVAACAAHRPPLNRRRPRRVLPTRASAGTMPGALSSAARPLWPAADQADPGAFDPGTARSPCDPRAAGAACRLRLGGGVVFFTYVYYSSDMHSRLKEAGIDGATATGCGLTSARLIPPGRAPRPRHPARRASATFGCGCGATTGHQPARHPGDPQVAPRELAEQRTCAPAGVEPAGYSRRVRLLARPNPGPPHAWAAPLAALSCSDVGSLVRSTHTARRPQEVFSPMMPLRASAPKSRAPLARRRCCRPRSRRSRPDLPSGIAASPRPQHRRTRSSRSALSARRRAQSCEEASCGSSRRVVWLTNEPAHCGSGYCGAPGVTSGRA